MDLRQKLEFQEVIDNYITDQEIYDLFSGFIGDLMLDKPDDPISYLIKKLSKKQHRRLFITGSSGRIRHEVSKEISSRFHMDIISSGELLKEEVERKGKQAKKILACWKEGTYVKDAIVLEIMMPVLERCENERISYILEGFPRTQVQAIALQRAGLVPDRLICLTSPPDMYKSDFIESYSQYAPSETKYESVSEIAYQEYEFGIKGVMEEYNFQCHEVQAEDDPSIVSELVYKAFLMKGRATVSRKPPKVLVIGGPLSGKSTQTRKVAEKYGLTLVCVTEVIEQAALENTDIGKIVSEYVKASQKIPDKIIIELMRERLEKTDCKMNGWVLDGFPVTYEQCRALKYLKQIPTNVYFLEGNDTLVFERAKNRRMDPKSGKIYGKEALEAPDLITVAGDDEESVRIRLFAWREDTIKIHAEFSKIGKSIKAEIAENLILESISDSLETSIPSES